MKRLSGLAVIAAVVALSGCGSTTAKTVTERVTAAAAPSTTTAGSRTASSRGHTAGRSTAARPKKKQHRAVVAKKPPSNWVSCDDNIAVLRPHTSCAFAQNAFYEYWVADGGSPLLVYSPAAGRSFATRCRSAGSQVLCATDDGGRARFSAAALAAYSADQADAYAASHDTGPDSTSAVVGGVDRDYDDGASRAGAYDETGDEIPNYDNGTGYRVRCADGMYSQSGGRPGACSGHGGVGR